MRSILDVAASSAMLAASVVVVWSMVAPRRVKKDQGYVPTTPILADGPAFEGKVSAPVVMIEFSDFQCPFCGQFAREVLPALRKKYVLTGIMGVSFKNFPLSIHPNARPAAIAADCAGAQGAFWQMHDSLFEQPQRLSSESLSDRAQQFRLDMQQLSKCEAGAGAADVQEQITLGTTYKITGTPTFFIGANGTDRRVRVTKRLSGALPLETFEEAIDETAKGLPKLAMAVQKD